ncbi:MAG: uracil-DNA glycosylase [Sulfurovum sp.]|nr:uracil-DNA glycosylase [Sulfurovum sp.]
MKNLLTQPTWRQALKDEWQESYMLELSQFLEEEKKQDKTILPPKHQWFTALNVMPLGDVKVVILGQDPYPTKGHAHGLCFSVLDDVKPLPKSLQNINKELLTDARVDNSNTGNLLPWSRQGVLLLNAVLTVEADNANTHKDKGWEKFTDRVVELVNSECEHVVFVLWGTYAQKKAVLIDEFKHLVIKDPHPSPLSAYRGFWGSKPFSQINSYLLRHNKKSIDWAL